MKSYIWVAFGFMGWAYYEMSGGADFVPEERVVAAVQEAAPEVVARADTAVLQSFSTSNAPEPAVAEATEAEVAEALTVALELQAVEPAPEAAPQAEPLAARMADLVDNTVIVEGADIRAVAGSRVNMRTGPGTNYGVVDTLSGGTQVQVIEVDANGWARLIDLDTGAEGWMAERLLSDPT